MSRRRRVREAGPVRKTVEVVVSALFGMAVVAVVLVLLQGGTSPASQGPDPGASTTGQTGYGVGSDGGIGIRSADPGTQGAPSGTDTVYSAQPAPTTPATAAQGATAAQASGATSAATTATTKPATAASGTATGSAGSGASATASASASASPSASSGALGGVVGGLVGGVLGLL